MRGKDLLEGMGKIDLSLIREAEEEDSLKIPAAGNIQKAEKQKGKGNMKIAAVAVAASILLMGGIIGTGIGISNREKPIVIDPEKYTEISESHEAEDISEEETLFAGSESAEKETKNPAASMDDQETITYLLIQSGDNKITVYDENARVLTSFKGLIDTKASDGLKGLSLSEGQTVVIRRNDLLGDIGTYTAGEKNVKTWTSEEKEADIRVLSDHLVYVREYSEDICRSILYKIDGTELERCENNAYSGIYFRSGDYIITGKNLYDLDGNLLLEHDAFCTDSRLLGSNYIQLDNGKVLAAMPSDNEGLNCCYCLYDPSENKIEKLDKDYVLSSVNKDTLCFYDMSGETIVMNTSFEVLIKGSDFLEQNEGLLLGSSEKILDVQSLNQSAWLVVTRPEGQADYYAYVCGKYFDVFQSFDLNVTGPYLPDQIKLASTAPAYTACLLQNEEEESYYMQVTLLSDFGEWVIPVEESQLADFSFEAIDDICSVKIVYDDGRTVNMLMDKSGEVLMKEETDGSYYLVEVDDHTICAVLNTLDSAGQDYIFMDTKGHQISSEGKLLYADENILCTEEDGHLTISEREETSDSEEIQESSKEEAAEVDSVWYNPAYLYYAQFGDSFSFIAFTAYGPVILSVDNDVILEEMMKIADGTKVSVGFDSMESEYPRTGHAIDVGINEQGIIDYDTAVPPQMANMEALGWIFGISR